MPAVWLRRVESDAMLFPSRFESDESFSPSTTSLEMRKRQKQDGKQNDTKDRKVMFRILGGTIDVLIVSTSLFHDFGVLNIDRLID